VVWCGGIRRFGKKNEIPKFFSRHFFFTSFSRHPPSSFSDQTWQIPNFLYFIDEKKNQ
jgi:hypothetical protein